MGKVGRLNRGHRLGIRKAIVSSSRGGWLMLEFKNGFNVCVSVKELIILQSREDCQSVGCFA